MTKPTQWQAACKSELQNFTRQDALRFWGAWHMEGDAKAPPFDYRFEHTLAVVKLGEWLGPQVGADMDVLLCAAWLHDCRKMLGSGKNKMGKDSHALDAAEAVAGILECTDFPPHKIPAVRHAILNHVGLSLDKPLDPLETACLWDIDKLSKLGATSLVHFLCINPGFQEATTSKALEMGKEWLNTAQRIASSMNTAPAKAEAATRLEFLRSFYGRLKFEWEGPEMK
ncbi:MAG: HD domain-containing protein [Holophagales bacterium]|jgi:uncharacterized protein|nr:HD domain-containing protein [Holophagales bacterium]